MRRALASLPFVLLAATGVRAEAPGAKILASGKVRPLAAGSEERFRGGFMADEFPAVKSHRVTVVETPAAP